MKHFQPDSCLQHNKKAIFLNQSEVDPQFKNLCLQCVSELKNELIVIDDFQQSIQELIINLIKQREQLNQNNLQCLIHLKDCILQFKMQQIISIEKYIQCIDQQINIMDEFQKQIYDYQIPIDNVDQFLSKYTEIEQLHINYEGIRDVIMSNLNSIQIQDFMPQFQEIINNLIFESQTDVVVTLSHIKSHIFPKNYDKEKLKIFCEKHNRQILMLDLNKQKTLQNRLACIDCIEEYAIKFTKLENFEQQWKDYQNTIQQENNKFNERITNTNKTILQYMNDFYKLLQNELKYTQKQLTDHANDYRMKTRQPIFKTIFQFSKEEIFEIAEELSNQNNQEKLTKEFESQYHNFKIQSDKILEDQEIIIQQLYKKMQKQIQESYYNIIDQHNINQQKIKPFKYEIMKQNCIKQQESCYALAFNNDSSILIAGCNTKIKIYQFINEELKEKQIISEQKEFTCLIFMKKRNHFISGSKDGSIIIWSIDNNQQWYYQQRLEEHNEKILCLILNECEDLLISSSWDKTIKFWNNTTKWISTQTILDHNEQVWSISMSPSQTKLISCGNDRIILILEHKKKENFWIIVQKINVEVRGYRICFLSDNSFVFQQWISNLMNFYQYDETKNEFKKKRDIIVKSGNSCDYLSPLQYIDNKSLLVNKNGFHINMIRRNEEETLKTEFTINFDTNYIYISISRDGEFLATWDNKTQEIQIRKFLID
ncbi:unnamed protein product [Paramecium pentaurelia]|uniref:WD40-repeat-containing domain n=1 Tax=Paramecium pentaurelia TaxID=43138 RepID=A0A8S1YL12_9CILI|nr:unnamed protein product [Paramecium pentaurelia]CAD8213147.1 unnamed protein product [Paramecium pentaurelia]